MVLCSELTTIGQVTTSSATMEIQCADNVQVVLFSATKLKFVFSLPQNTKHNNRKTKKISLTSEI